MRHRPQVLAALVFPTLALSCGPTTVSVTAPKVTISVDNAAPLEGADISLKANVTGGSGGELTYKWEQTSPKVDGKNKEGRFSNALTAQTAWTTPSLCENLDFTFTLTVKDGNTTATATTTVSAVNTDKPFAITQQPSATPLNTTSPIDNLTSGDAVALVVGADAPGCGPVFAWKQVGATDNQFVNMDNTSATVQWRSPAVASTTTTQFQVTVTSPDGNTFTSEPLSVTYKAATFANVKATFQDRCTDCHNTAQKDQNGKLDLSGDTAALQTLLLGPANDTALCGTDPTKGNKYVIPSDPTNSVIWRRVAGDGGAGCSPMPNNDTGFFRAHEDARTQFKSWILSGAAFN